MQIVVSFTYNLFMEKKGLLLVLPALIGTFLFIIIPIFCSFGLSFSEWDLLNEIHYVGFSNYKSVFTEPEFLQILINTIVYAVSTTIFAVIIPLLIASIINNKIKGNELFKTIYFLPFITPAVVIAIVWAWIFDPNIGLVNTLFNTHYTWLFSTKLAMPVHTYYNVREINILPGIALPAHFRGKRRYYDGTALSLFRTRPHRNQRQPYRPSARLRACRSC